MEKLIEEFKNAITKQDLTFDRPVCVFNNTTEDRYPVIDVIEYDSKIVIFYSDWVEDSFTMNIDDVWTRFCTVDTSKPVHFLYTGDNNLSTFVGVDDCLDTAIDFNVEMSEHFLDRETDEIFQIKEQKKETLINKMQIETAVSNGIDDMFYGVAKRFQISKYQMPYAELESIKKKLEQLMVSTFHGKDTWDNGLVNIESFRDVTGYREKMIKRLNSCKRSDLGKMCAIILGEGMIDMIDCDKEAVIDNLEGVLTTSTDEVVADIYDKLTELNVL